MKRGMSRRVASFVIAATASVLLSFPAFPKPQPVVRVTSGEHPSFGRVVLDAPGLTYTVSRDGGHVTVKFSKDPILSELPVSPRNVLGMRATPGGMELTVLPGANVHTVRMGSKIVIDIDDTAPTRPPAPLPDVPSKRAPSEAPRGAIVAAPQAASPLVDKPASELAPKSAGAPERRRGKAPRAAEASPTASVVTPPAKNEAPAPEVVRKSSLPEATPATPEPAHSEPVKQEPPRPDVAGTEPPKPEPNKPVPPSSLAARSEMTTTGADVPPPRTVPAPTNPPERPSIAPPDKPAAPGLEASVDVIRPGATTPDATIGPARAIPPQPGPETTTTAEANPAPALPPNPRTTDPSPVRVAGEPVPDEPGGPQQEPAQSWPVTRETAPSGPVALVAVKARPPGGLPGTAVQIPFAEPVGAALFSRGSQSFVVFDERRPIDLAALRDDPVFGTAVVAIYPSATVIQLTRSPGQSAMLSAAAAGWRVSIVPATPRPAALIAVSGNDVMTFAADAPGQVVTITDPRTGGTLLVGTQLKSGQGVLTERRTPEFLLPVTGQGIVVDPLSSTIGLRITQAGFVLSGAREGLAVSPPQAMADATLEAARLTRLFEFPRQTTDDLAWRARRQAVAAATTQSLARGPKRHALAETLLGLGMGVEAQTLLRVTMKDDPAEAASPATIGLAAVAALLAGRPAEATDLADPRLNGTDEIALWRALRAAMADEASPQAASALATVASLLFTYPAQMRHRVLPLALETMVLGGEAETSGRLLAQREKDPDLDYARALLTRARGDNEAALKLFDALANGPSARDHARAAVRATELRLEMRLLDTKAAADELEGRLYAWRGDSRDLALRLRIADLRRKSGAWRGMFTQLRAAKADFPAQAADIDRRMKEAFADLPRDPMLETMPPTDLIALLEENAELMGDGPESESLRIRLAEKLMALDLPKRADPLLAKLMRAAPLGPSRAGFGATLASVRLREGDPDGAILALSESNSADMPDGIRERRALISARVDAKRGATKNAVDALSGSRSQEADELRASILEQAKDWPGARDALVVLAERVVPGSGTLNPVQLGVVLRLASAATRAGDDAMLGSLRDRLRTRIGTGAQADLFRLLTAEPVRGTADLGRARAEMGLARAISAGNGQTPKLP